ncbi:hypothetical protein ACJ73_04650 [Blastomyces percursus]|uniref:Mid2 domain-containing protein n=1 Tax=Blastomyces percursus TaxID=1658174 RepID=A0A1J9R8M0_9EURO|nr:hypothetical protein ACJ73_04650 [Blastomyces percursus]
MRDPSLCILVVSGWACLFTLSWASPVDLSPTKFPLCPSPPTWDVKDAAGFPVTCPRSSRPSQRVRLFKSPNRRRQKGRFLERMAASQNEKKNRAPVGSNGEKRQIIDEPTHERDPFFLDLIATSFPEFTDPPQFTSKIWEDPFDEPSTSPLTTFITGVAQTRTTFTPRTSITLPTPTPTQIPENSEISEQSKSDAGPIIAGCSIGGIALIAILYLAFNAWRRSRNKKRGAGTSTPPPPYASQPMGEREGPQTGFVAREATPEIYPPAWAHTASWTPGLDAENPPDLLGPLQRQHRRVSRRYYSALCSTATDSNSSDLSTLHSNSSSAQNRGVGTYTQTSNPAEPFANLPIVTEESPYGNLALTAPAQPLESIAEAERQPTSYRSRRDSRDIIRRSVFGSISSNNSSNGPDQGTTDYDWQNVSYPTPTAFGRHHGVSPIEPTHIDHLPFGNQRSPPPTLDTPQRWPSNVRPNSPVLLGSVENVEGQHGIVTRPLD